MRSIFLFVIILVFAPVSVWPHLGPLVAMGRHLRKKAVIHHRANPKPAKVYYKWIDGTGVARYAVGIAGVPAKFRKRAVKYTGPLYRWVDRKGRTHYVKSYKKVPKAYRPRAVRVGVK